MTDINFRDLMREAYQVAFEESTDTSTKNGAILIDLNGRALLRGVNSFTNPDMANDPRNRERPRKYKVTEHAERAVIYKAASCGCTTTNLIMVCPWACCTDCARGIVLAGIPLVVAHQQAFDKTPERWREEVDFGIKILRESGVKYMLYDGKIGGVKSLFNGEVWHP